MFVNFYTNKLKKMNIKLKKDFYNGNVLNVAKNLLGKYFVVKDKKSDCKLIAKIVEVEAYDGRIDEAAHTFNGKTERNSIMFEEGGYLYVYFTYGIHFCANVVTGSKDEGTAVLLRAMEPIKGSDLFLKRRFGNKDFSELEKINMLNGPAKICQAFGLTRDHNGTNLLLKDIYITEGEKIRSKDIVSTERIGIKKSTELKWRFYIKNSPFISKK